MAYSSPTTMLLLPHPTIQDYPCNIVAVPSSQYIIPHQTSTISNSLAYYPSTVIPMLTKIVFSENSQSVSRMRCQNIIVGPYVHQPSSPSRQQSPMRTAVSHLSNTYSSPASFLFLSLHNFCWKERHFISYPLHLHLS